MIFEEEGGTREWRRIVVRYFLLY